MKRITFVLVYLFPVCLMLLATGNANAQVASTKGRFHGVPKTFTSSGKPVLYSNDDDNNVIIIYDEDMQVAKRMEIAPFHYESKSWYEYAKVMPTGAEIMSSTVTESNAMSKIGIDLTKVTSVDEVNTLLESTEYYDGYHCGYFFIAYLDDEGKICIGEINKFFGSAFFGMKYNNSYFTVLDGREVYVFAQYKYIYPEDNILWEADMDNAEIYTGTRELLSDMDFYDYDSSVTAEQYLNITQNLFNDDEQWEYISPVYEMRTRYDEPRIDREDEEGLMLRRYVYYDAEICKYAIVSEDGDVLAPVLPPNENMKSWNEGLELYRMNGKFYLEVEWGDSYDGYYRVLYQIDTKANSIKMLQKVKGEGRFASVSDNTIQMQLDDNEKGQDVMLSDMAGQVLDKSHIPAGQHSAQMNASHLRYGIYNVTLMQNGKVQKSQKIRIK